MPIVVSEQWGRRLSDSSGEILYLVTGTTSVTAARSAVESAAPATLNLLPLHEVEVREIEGLEEGVWTAAARYSSGSSGGSGTPDDSFRFDTTGGTEHVTLALQHINQYALPDETATNFKGAIGVNGESAEGVTIAVPKFGFSIIKYVDDVDVDASYIAGLYALTGRTNDASYSITVDGKTLPYNRGELLFMGVTGAKNVSAGYWELTFNFAASPNEASLVVGEFTIDKNGWEYVWARMEKREDSATSQIVSKAVSLHVERVYKEGDFDALGL